jgi:hypothetical protein
MRSTISSTGIARRLFLESEHDRVEAAADLAQCLEDAMTLDPPPPDPPQPPDPSYPPYAMMRHPNWYTLETMIRAGEVVGLARALTWASAKRTMPLWTGGLAAHASHRHRQTAER